MGNSSSQLDSIGNQVTSLQSLLSNYSQVSQYALTPTSGVSIDYTSLGNLVSKSPAALGRTAAAILNSGTTFTGVLVPAMLANDAVISSIQSVVSGNSSFRNTVSGILKSNQNYSAILKGPTGASGGTSDYSTLMANLYTNKLSGAPSKATIWCGPNGQCGLPSDTGTITSGSPLTLNSGLVKVGGNASTTNLDTPGTLYSNNIFTNGDIGVNTLRGNKIIVNGKLCLGPGFCLGLNGEQLAIYSADGKFNRNLG